MAGPGRLRKIAFLGGAERSLAHAPWHDSTWELWAHASCRHKCEREPDVLFDLHPPELWKNPAKKIWDKAYAQWLAQNHIPIYMQERYAGVPAAIRYPFERMIAEFPRGYMTNHVAYMMALALMEGVTHVGLFGCDYTGTAEYEIQRGCAEYWCGVAEGRGVHLAFPAGCELLNRPHLLYGYQSHPNGVRHPSYSASKRAAKQPTIETPDPKNPNGTKTLELTPLSAGGDQIPLMPLPEPPALDRATLRTPEEFRAYHEAQQRKT